MVVPFVIEFFTYAFSEIKVFGSVCAGVRVVRIGFFSPGYCDGGLRGFAPVEAECIDAFYFCIFGGGCEPFIGGIFFFGYHGYFSFCYLCLRRLGEEIVATIKIISR